jgi:hypothetical protein
MHATLGSTHRLFASSVVSAISVSCIRPWKSEQGKRQLQFLSTMVVPKPRVNLISTTTVNHTGYACACRYRGVPGQELKFSILDHLSALLGTKKTVSSIDIWRQENELSLWFGRQLDDAANQTGQNYYGSTASWA